MISVYVHIPFCRTRCNYCDFCSTATTELIETFKRALLTEIGTLQAENPHKSEPIGTIFFGGGTPSLIDPGYFHTVLAEFGDHARLEGDCEITLEANPDDLAPEIAVGYVSAGINRISLGIQSFVDSELAFLSRRHSTRKAIEAASVLRELGINFSVDLMYGIPCQTVDSWCQTVESAIGLEPKHVSAYCLTLEGGTPLQRMVERDEVRELDDDTLWLMYRSAIELLLDGGYEQYEVSNFSKPGFRCRHNLSYWTGAPYIGFGPSAASYMNSRRWRNTTDIRRYCELTSSGKTAVEETEEICDDIVRREFLMLSLRLTDGMDLEEYQSRFSSDLIDTHGDRLRAFEEDGYAVIDDDGRRMRLTPKGLFQSDAIVASLI